MTAEERPFYIKFSNGLIIIVLLIFLLHVGQHVLMPIAFAGLVSILLVAPCKFLEKHGLSRGLSALISLLLALVFFAFIFYFISSRLYAFKQDGPEVMRRLTLVLQELRSWIQEKFHVSTDKMDNVIDSISSESVALSVFSSTFTTISSVFLYTILTILYTFLLLLYRRLVVQFFITSFTEYSNQVYEVIMKTRYVIKSYLVGLIIEMLIVAAMNVLGFFILGVKYAFLLGVIVALLNLVPYLGIFIACLLSMLITFTTNSSGTVLGVAIVVVIVHLVDSNVLFPKIVGSKVKMNALATIFGVIVGETLWGIPGMFLAIPIIAILKVVFEATEGVKPWSILLGDDLTVEITAKSSLKNLAKPFIKAKEKRIEEGQKRIE